MLQYLHCHLRNLQLLHIPNLHQFVHSPILLQFVHSHSLWGLFVALGANYDHGFLHHWSYEFSTRRNMVYVNSFHSISKDIATEQFLKR